MLIYGVIPLCSQLLDEAPLVRVIKESWMPICVLNEHAPLPRHPTVRKLELGSFPLKSKVSFPPIKSVEELRPRYDVMPRHEEKQHCQTYALEG